MFHMPGGEECVMLHRMSTNSGKNHAELPARGRKTKPAQNKQISHPEMLHFLLPLQDVIVEEDDNPQCRHAWRSVKKTRPRRQTPQKLSFVTQYNSGSHLCKSPMSQDFSLTRWFNRLLADPPIKCQADAVIFVALKKLLSVVFPAVLLYR